MRATSFRLAALAIAAALSSGAVIAQTAPAKPAAKPAAKAPAKPAAKEAPAPAKPKQKLLTRDELRACIDRQDANKVEAKALEEAEAQLGPERETIMKEADAIKQREKELIAEQDAIQADMAAMGKRAEEVKEQMKKLSKKEAQALAAEYQKQADEVNARIEPHNNKRKAFREALQAANLDARIEAFNKRKDDVSTRFDKLGDAQDAWRAECGNKPYDEADEIAIKKERAAKAAAAGK